jgi:NTP pyrophosphatase (non-canonical NTP hydrolase)
MAWVYEPIAGDHGFYLVGPVTWREVADDLATWFPPDAEAQWDAGSTTHTVRWGDLVALEGLPTGVRLRLPGNPTGVGPTAYVVARLLGPGGCPWDRAQTPVSLIRYLLEEPYEAAEAILTGDADATADELGDVLLQVVFQSALQEAAGRFDLDTVARRQAAKLVRRHPHVFGDASADEVLARWDADKSREAAHPEGNASGVYPPLVRLRRALSAGWTPPEPDTAGVWRERWTDFLAEQPDRTVDHVVSALAGIVEACRALHLDVEWAVAEVLARPKSP